MKLKYITFTGADDETAPDQMLKISESTPQVEWGVLLSASMSSKYKGSPRFPSHNWLIELNKQVHGCEFVNLSGHLCGRYVRDILHEHRFSAYEDREELEVFDRYQINFHGVAIGEEKPWGVHKIVTHFGKYPFIFQMDGVNDHHYMWLQENLDKNTSLLPLFDRSHGEGVLLKDGAEPIDNVLCGYAGGLGPENLEKQLQVLSDRVGDREIWIDMETRVRNEYDEFDLDLVRKCIDIAAPYF